VKCQGDREGCPYHTRIEILYITENVLYWSLPARFVRFLLRVMMYPGGFPLMNPNSLLLVNRGFLL